jgi:hypothetical protein
MHHRQIWGLKMIDSRLYFRVSLLFAVLIVLSRFWEPEAALLLPVQIQTGPDIGQTIPPFGAVDQDGRRQTFETIRGPRGAMIVFYRSADW